MSSTLTVRFDRRALARLSTQAVEGQLLKAGHFLRNQVVRNISTPSSVYGHSKPGEFPHVVSGRLRMSIFVRTDKGPTVLGMPTRSVIVGTPLRYGLYHEYVSGRSFLRRTLAEQMPRLQGFFRGARISRS